MKLQRKYLQRQNIYRHNNYKTVWKKLHLERNQRQTRNNIFGMLEPQINQKQTMTKAQLLSISASSTLSVKPLQAIHD